MKVFLRPFFLAAILSFSVFSQTPTPTPPIDDDVVRISTTLIQTDVTVTDRKGKIVGDLKAEDFEIYENGVKQNITNFSFISSVKEIVEQPKKSDDKFSVPAPPIQMRPADVRRTIALVVDDLSLSFESAYYVRRALKKYVDEQMRPGDLAAVIRTGAGIGALQQFTADKRMLYAAIERVKWNPLGRGNISAFAPINDVIQTEETDSESTEETDSASQSTTDQAESLRQSYLATGTLGALNYVVGGMSELPGRKSVILFSDGFRIIESADPNSTDGRVIDYLRKLIDAANRASVVFYTIDARGLQTLGLTAADSISNPTPERMQAAMSARRDELFDTQSGLTYLAKETGGIAIINSNDISGGVKRIVEDQSYYLIGYMPDADTFDPQKQRFNKLEVKVNRKDLNVRYRSGFINVADRENPDKPIFQTAARQIQNALASPFAVNDISLRLNTLFGFEEKSGAFVRSLLHIKADDLKFTDEPDGMKKAVFDILAVSFGDNGAPIDQISKTYTLRAKKDVYERILREGFVYNFVFPIKKPGAYQFRVALRDAQAEKVGSASQFIEVPNLKKNRLTVSGIILENLTQEQWKNLASDTDFVKVSTNPMSDTSLRRFKHGTNLRYGYEVYNAKFDAAQKPNLTSRIRVFRENKIVLDGKETPVNLAGQTDFKRIRGGGAIFLSDRLQAGDYILQIIVTDNSAKEKRKISTQFVQFEVTEK